MRTDDEVFSDICTFLNNNDINYWICHGTLLGIIRENRLLPWDNDLDFAVWDHENDKGKIISLFESNGYRQEFIFGDNDCLHFMGASKQVDVSFYKVHEGLASIKWAIPPQNMLYKLFIMVASKVGQKNENGYNKNILSKQFIKNFLVLIIEIFSSLLRIFLSKKLKKILIRLATNKMRHIGYSYPISMLKIIKMDYNGMIIPIPIDSEACLCETYGADWQIPKKEYVWYKEAKNLAGLSR